MPENIEINYVFDENRISRENGGALQVIINGQRLNKYVNEEELNNGKWNEYSGDFLYGDLYDLLEKTVNIASKPKIYETHEVRFAGYDDYIILEYLGNNKIRVAFRIFQDSSEDSSHYCAKPSSACGYTVDIKNWIEALEETVKDYQEDLRHHDTRDSDEWYDSEIKELNDIKNKY